MTHKLFDFRTTSRGHVESYLDLFFDFLSTFLYHLSLLIRFMSLFVSLPKLEDDLTRVVEPPVANPTSFGFKGLRKVSIKFKSEKTFCVSK